MPPIPPLFTLPIQPNGRIIRYVLPHSLLVATVICRGILWGYCILPAASPPSTRCLLSIDDHSTQPFPRIYLLTFESPPDNRLTPSFCKSFLLALDILDHRFPKGVVVTTSGIPKFYSNGLDYESAVKDGQEFWGGSLYPLWRRLLTYVYFSPKSTESLRDLFD